MNENPIVNNLKLSPVPEKTALGDAQGQNPETATVSPIEALLARLKAAEKGKKVTKGAFGKRTLYDTMMKKRYDDPVRVERREKRKKELMAKAEAKKKEKATKL
jgi:hypothetical protein